MKKLNVAIIGQGRSGFDIHGTFLLTERGKELFNVVAVVDFMEGRRKKAEEVFHCDTYADYKELFKRDDLDFVVVSTFSNYRFPVVMDLLNHKLNVLRCNNQLTVSSNHIAESRNENRARKDFIWLKYFVFYKPVLAEQIRVYLIVDNHNVHSNDFLFSHKYFSLLVFGYLGIVV